MQAVKGIIKACSRGCARAVIAVVLGIMTFAWIPGLAIPAPLFAASNSLEIMGDGITDAISLTRDQLEKMDKHRYVYSVINTWPTKKCYVGEGVGLKDLLDKAGIKEEARLLRFTSSDGYVVMLTVQELLLDERFYFPNFRENAVEGHVPGDPSKKVNVEPIIALLSVEGSDNPKYMNDLHTPMLMLGQRAVTEQTGNLFIKYLTKIEVLSDEPQRWDAPRANPESGIVPEGTMVTLSNTCSDDDKIHYTIDGTTPTMESPMYNRIASRWWSARADVLGTINRPIGPIKEDLTIRAVTIGPGKMDSDVVTFNYRIAGVGQPGQSGKKSIKLTVDSLDAVVNGVIHTLDAAPYLSLETGRTLVPLRFVGEALGAAVEWDPQSARATITAGNKVIIFTAGSSEVFINGVKHTIDCAAAIRPPGRTFVPLRFVSESLGAQVVYEQESRTINITI